MLSELLQFQSLPVQDMGYIEPVAGPHSGAYQLTR